MAFFNLRLFGGATLEGGHGTVRGRAAHKRRLALLALLAVGRGRTMARERLIAYLWSEADIESGRHALSESLYVLRKALGESAFVTAGDEVGVDPAIVSCDVAAFEESIAGGALEQAAELYAGPFLDGFYVSDAPEFERWAETERDRLARAYAGALERLAEARQAAGEWTVAVEWWRRLYAHDPYSSRVALRLMTGLDAAGERAAAIKVAAAHAALLREELGAEPEPAVLALAQRLRAEPAPATEPPPRPANHLLSLPPLPESSVVDVPPERETASEPSVAPGGSADTPRAADPDAKSIPPEGTRAEGALKRLPRSTTRLLVISAALALAVVTALGTWVAARTRKSDMGVTVAVFSFATVDEADTSAGADPAELRRLFSSAFTLVPGLWTVDAPLPSGTMSWREVPPEALQRLARDRGARYVVMPEVLSVAPLRVAISVHDAETWRLVERENSAPGEPIAGAIQRMGLTLARAMAHREHLDFAQVGYLLGASDSAAALSHFMVATSIFRAGNAQNAAGEFRRAINADSLFLLAYHRLSVAETWYPTWNFAAAREAVDAGLAFRELARPIDVELLTAQRHFVMREGRDAIERFTRLTVNDPSLLDGWLGKGEAVFHYQGLQGGSPTDALSAFEQVVRMDSTFSPAYEHLAEIAVRMGDEERARQYAPRVRGEKARPSYTLAVELRFGSASERAGAFAVLDTAPRNTISNLVRIFAFDPGMVDTLSALLMRRPGPDGLQGVQYRLASRAAQGRWREGLNMWRSGHSDPFDKWLVHAHLAGYRTPEAAEMLRWAQGFVKENGGPDFRAREAKTKDPFRALVHLALVEGDSADVTFLTELLESAARRADPSDPEPSGLRASLRARQALQTGDTAGAIRRLEESLERAPWWVSSWAPLADAAPQRLLLTELLLARGQQRQAERWLNSFGNIGAVGDLLYRERVARLRASLQPVETSSPGTRMRRKQGADLFAQ